MAILKELLVPQREYTDKEGKKKTFWLKVGELQEYNGREVLAIYRHINFGALPAKPGDDRVFVTMSDPRGKEGAPATAPERQQPKAATGGSFADLPDDLPF